jgi:excisionase family DNA binding protein
MTTRTVVNTPKLAYRISEITSLTGLSRSSVYRLVANRELVLIKLGLRSSAVTRDSLITYAAARGLPLPSSF